MSKISFDDEVAAVTEKAMMINQNTSADVIDFSTVISL